MKTTSTKKKSVAKIIEIELEQKLKKIAEQNQEQLQNIFQNAPAAIAIFEGPEHKYVLANKAYEKLSNRKSADLLGKSMQDLFPELNGTGTLELFDKVLETGESFSDPEYALMVDLKNEGIPQQCYFNFSMEPLKNNSGEIYAVMAMTYDITEQVESRKRIEESDKALRASQESLKKNERQLQNVFHATTVAIGVLEGIEHKYSFVNPVTCQILNRTKEELLGKTVKEVFPEVEAQGIIQLYDEVYNTGKPFAINELSVQMDLLNDGVVCQNYYNLSCEPLRDNKDKIYAILVTAVDVTEQVLTRKKIEESETRFRNLVEQAPVAMCVVRGDNFVFEVANEKHLQLLGRAKEDIMNMPVFIALPETQGQGYQEVLEGIYKTGIPFSAKESPLPIIRNGKKEIIYVNYIFEPLYDIAHKVDGVFSIATDVTELVLARKKVEESENRFHELIYSSPSMIAILKGEDLIIEVANDAILEQLGKGKQIIGLPFSKAVPEMEEQGFGELLRQVYKTGIAYHAYEMPGNLLYNGIEITNYYVNNGLNS